MVNIWEWLKMVINFIHGSSGCFFFPRYDDKSPAIFAGLSMRSHETQVWGSPPSITRNITRGIRITNHGMGRVLESPGIQAIGNRQWRAASQRLWQPTALWDPSCFARPHLHKGDTWNMLFVVMFSTGWPFTAVQPRDKLDRYILVESMHPDASPWGGPSCSRGCASWRDHYETWQC